MPPGELPARVQASVPLVELHGPDQVSVPPEGSQQGLASVPLAEPLEPGLASVPRAGPLEPGLVLVVVRLERLEQWGDPGILFATL